MKAIVLKGFGGVDHLHLADIEKPEVTPETVLIRIRAAAFNPIDYQMRQGRRERHLMTSQVLGRELAGVIVEVGAKVKGFLPGDEVMAASGSRGSNGSYATYMTLSPELLARKPANISFEQATAIPSAGLTAWQCFSRMKITPEQTVFITGGSGAVGSFLIRLLKLHGIDRILTTSGNPVSSEALIALGLKAENIIDYKTDDLEKKALTANGGRPFDFTVDLVGGGISETAAAVLKVNGTYLDVTFLGTEQTREILFDKGAVVVNISNYAYALNNNLEWYGATLTHLAGWIEGGKISPPSIHIVGELDLKTVQEAHLWMENNKTKGKKLVMTVAP